MPSNADYAQRQFMAEKSERAEKENMKLELRTLRNKVRSLEEQVQSADHGAFSAQGHRGEPARVFLSSAVPATRACLPTRGLWPCAGVFSAQGRGKCIVAVSMQRRKYVPVVQKQ